MITQLKGKLIEINPTYAIIDCGGVGYWVNISLQTFSKLEKEELVTIFTHFVVREDSQTLYGFYAKNEREIFQKLIGVNGVGPSSAMMMISSLSTEEIINAIEQANTKVLQSVKGIGLKTAQRIIIDLKDKLTEESVNFNINSISSKNKSKFEALTALEVLGIPKKNAEKAIEFILKENPEAPTDVLVKETLKRL